MSFVSTGFAVFVISLLILYYLLPKKYRYLVLLFGSIFYYVYTCGFYFIYILVSALSICLASYLMGRTMEKGEVALAGASDRDEKKRRKAETKKRLRLIMILTLVLNFGILIHLKYSAFFVSNLNLIRLRLTGSTDFLPVHTFLLPLGISFYTLQAAGYIIDLYYKRVEVEKNPLKIMLFVMFFPQVVQGPICKLKDVRGTLFEGNEFDEDNLFRGGYIILYGLFKKLVVADRLSGFVTTASQNYQMLGGTYLLLMLFLYSLELYADFSGGIDIALGTARMFGVRLQDNFRRPFFSKSVSEYWRRWHITLGAWFRDYVFYPISISKKLMKAGRKLSEKHPFIGKHLSLYTATAVVWFLTGLWHGNEWRYILWGLLNGLILCVSAELEPLYARINAKIGWSETSLMHRAFSAGRTFIIMMFLRVFDLSYGGVGMAFDIVKRIFTMPQRIDPTVLEALSLPGYELKAALFGIAVMFVVDMLERRESIYDRLMKTNFAVRLSVCGALFALTVIYGYYGMGYDAGSFIYMQF